MFMGGEGQNDDHKVSTRREFDLFKKKIWVSSVELMCLAGVYC